MALPKEPQTASSREQILERLFPEKHKVVERPTEPEIAPEIEKHLEPVPGAEISLPQPVQDDTTGAVVVDTAAPQQVTITLPLTDDQLKAGLAVKTTNSLRWLTEWCLRLLKKVSGTFIYRSKKR